MVGDPDKTEKTFTPDDYEGFYTHHSFQPMLDEYALRANEIIPRFGWAIDRIEELRPENVLDLGCLDGSFALSVGSQLNIPVIGVDLTQDGIDLARERAEQHGIEAQFEQGSVETWLAKFAEQGRKFGCITFFEIMEHVKDAPLVLKLIDAVLAPGGTVLVSTPDFESPRFGADDEENKCHIRLYTTADEDYERENKYGHVRKATSITKEIGKDRIVDMRSLNDLINVEYK